MYQNLKSCLKDPLDSVHFLPIPEVDASLECLETEEKMKTLLKTLQLVRSCRFRSGVTGRVNKIIFCFIVVSFPPPPS